MSTHANRVNVTIVVLKIVVGTLFTIPKYGYVFFFTLHDRREHIPAHVTAQSYPAQSYPVNVSSNTYFNRRKLGHIFDFTNILLKVHMYVRNICE